MGLRASIAAACTLGALGLGDAAAADLIILTNQGATPGVRELAAAFSQASGHKVSVIQEAGAALERRLNSDAPGDLLTANQNVARLLEKDQIYVRVYVPEPQLGLIRVGQKAKLKVDTFPDRFFDGVIEQISTQGEFTPRNVQSRDERNHLVFAVKVRIDNREGKLKAGMAADVTFEK